MIAVYCTNCGVKDFEFELEEGETLPALCPMCGKRELYEIDHGK